MNKLNRAVMIISKIIEVMYFLLVGLAVVGLSVGIAFKERATEAAEAALIDGSLTVNGMSVEIIDKMPQSVWAALMLTLVTIILCSGLLGMIFRNIYLIFRTAQGKTWFSEGETPFQPDNIRMVREIGIFSIMIPIVELIMSTIVRLIISPDLVEINVSLNGVIFGLVILALSQFFAYGTQLQQDVDGLL